MGKAECGQDPNARSQESLCPGSLWASNAGVVGKLLLDAAQFSFRVYQCAEGFDKQTKQLFTSVNDFIQMENARKKAEPPPPRVSGAKAEATHDHSAEQM